MRTRRDTYDASIAPFWCRDSAYCQLGFQLLELLIAIAVVGVLTAIAVPSYTMYRDKADNATAAAGVLAIEQAIERFYTENNKFPDDLNQANMGGLKDPWGNAYQYLRIHGAGLKGVGKMRKDRSLHPLNTDYDLCSMGKNGITATQIISGPGKDDIIRANNGDFIGLAADY